MPTLSFNVTRWDWWSASVSIPYTLSYNASTNKTTVTFSACSLTYPGRNNYGTDSETTLTVKAGDNQSSSGTTSFTTSGTSKPSGETYTGTPSPVSVTVQHSAGPGAKTVTVEANTTIHLDPRNVGSNVASQYYYISGSGSRTDTSKTVYSLSISQGTGTTVSVTRSGTALANNSLIYPGDSLTFTYSVSTGYTIGTHTVKEGSGSATTRSSGYSWTVSGNAAVVTTATVNTYTLSFANGTGYTLTVQRTQSPVGGGSTNVNLSSGATIYYGDKLKITAAIQNGYALSTLKANTTNVTNGGTYTCGTGNVAVTATAVALASTISSYTQTVTTVASNGSNNFTLTVSKNNGAYRHKATFTATDMTAKVSGVFDETLNYRIDHSWFNEFPNASTLTVTVSVQTYTDSTCTTTAGSPVTASFTVNLANTQTPTINSGFVTRSPLTTLPTGATISHSGLYIQGYSKCQLVLDKSKITNANSATVASYRVVCQSYTGTKSSPGASETFTTNTLTTAGTVNVSITVTDSRGRTASTTVALTVQEYYLPSFQSASAQRCADTSGTLSDDGQYIWVLATQKIASVSSRNSATITVRYKKVSAPDWTPGSTVTSGTGTAIGGGNIDVDFSYNVMFTVTDLLNNSASTTLTVAGAVWAMKFRKDSNGLGVGFGKAPDHTMALEIPSGWEMYFGTETFKEHAQRLINYPGISLPNGADLDNYTAFGSYYRSSNSVTLSNAPPLNANFRLEVISSGTSTSGNCLQFAWSNYYENIYYRRCVSGTWYAWRRLLNDYADEIQAGTLTVNDLVTLVGYITDGRKEMTFDYVLPRTTKCSNVSITRFKGNVRTVNGGNGGYVDSSDATSIEWTGSAYTCSATLLGISGIGGYRVRITVRKSTAFSNTTNNTPAVFYGQITLVFS